jgi:uncharacterized coiled-coil protein SlyX
VGSTCDRSAPSASNIPENVLFPETLLPGANAWSYADINLDELSISATMPDQPPSQMIRVPTPLVDAVRELSRLHRLGRTKAVLEGIQRLVATIDSDIAIDIDSVSESISKLTERLDRMEAQHANSSVAADIDNAMQPISERLEKLESDVGAIAQTIQDLSTRVFDLERVGDIDYAVTPLSEPELSGDIRHDIGVTPRQQEQDAFTADVEPIAEPPADTATDSDALAELEPALQAQAPLTQKALAARLGTSEKTIHNFRQKGSIFLVDGHYLAHFLLLLDALDTSSKQVQPSVKF